MNRGGRETDVVEQCNEFAKLRLANLDDGAELLVEKGRDGILDAVESDERNLNPNPASKAHLHNRREETTIRTVMGSQKKESELLFFISWQPWKNAFNTAGSSTSGAAAPISLNT